MKIGGVLLHSLLSFLLFYVFTKIFTIWLTVLWSLNQWLHRPLGVCHQHNHAEREAQHCLSLVRDTIWAWHEIQYLAVWILPITDDLHAVRRETDFWWWSFLMRHSCSLMKLWNPQASTKKCTAHTEEEEKKTRNRFIYERLGVKIIYHRTVMRSEGACWEV